MMFSQNRPVNVSEETYKNYLQSYQYVSQTRIQQRATQPRMSLFRPTKGCSSCGK
jgi:hypothetical protein